MTGRNLNSTLFMTGKQLHNYYIKLTIPQMWVTKKAILFNI